MVPYYYSEKNHRCEEGICSSIDLALNTDKVPEIILARDYHTKRLRDAERAVWVIG